MLLQVEKNDFKVRLMTQNEPEVLLMLRCAVKHCYVELLIGVLEAMSRIFVSAIST